MSVESFFLNYAAPCANNLVHLEKLTEEQHEELMGIVSSGKLPARPYLERTFPAAFVRIKAVAKDMEIADHWDRRVLERYWHEMHNRYIDAGDGTYGRMPASFCELCKVHVAKIVDARDRVFVVQYEPHDKKGKPTGKVETRTVVADLLPSAKRGDTIRIHSGYAVEFA